MSFLFFFITTNTSFSLKNIDFVFQDTALLISFPTPSYWIDKSEFM